jgi:hypothetical protein
MSQKVVLSFLIFKLFLKSILCWIQTKSGSGTLIHSCPVPLRQKVSVPASVADPDPQDPYVFGPPGYGSGSGSGSFYNQAKMERKTLFPTLL